MNRFIFVMELRDGRIVYGHLRASDGDDARTKLIQQMEERKLQPIRWSFVGMNNDMFRIEDIGGS